jgi:hypothetical protein
MQEQLPSVYLFADKRYSIRRVRCAYLLPIKRYAQRTLQILPWPGIIRHPGNTRYLAFSGKKEILLSLILLPILYCRGSECKTFRICLTAASIFKSSRIRPNIGLALLASPSAPTSEKSAPL